MIRSYQTSYLALSPAGRVRAAVTMAAVLAFVCAIGLRLWVGHGLPLWLDESWTGMIASQTGWSAFWREAWLDVNPPLYYGLMACWTTFAGLSDAALRAPSLFFAIAAAALPLVWQMPGLSRWSGLAWAALLLLWAPGVDMALDARGYALLLALSVAQTIAFAHLLTAPTLGRAATWSMLASLAGLTHYHALLLAGLQGLGFLWRHRLVALRCWPAALAFVPSFGWLLIHAPRLADYARPDVAWYPPMTLDLALSYGRYVLGATDNGLIALVVAVIAATALISRGRPAVLSSRPVEQAWRYAVFLAVAALALELILGSLRPMVTERYLVPLVPSLLLGLILAVRRWQWGSWGLAGLLLVYLGSIDPSDLRSHLVKKTQYGFAPASRFIAEVHPTALVFVWDHPAAQVLDPGSVAKLGSFFLARAGQPVPVTPLILRPGDDGNRILAAQSSQAGVIWIYNRARASAARTIPPQPLAWPGRKCQLDRSRWVGTLACRPVADKKPAPGGRFAKHGSSVKMGS